tara:strand:- start:1693 stop:2292 length:600 start_codon:yes stop_codon:yes gene_type:complete
VVAIIDYGMGNVASVQKAVKALNIESVVTNNKAIIEKSHAIILPGVGSFKQGMRHLHDRDLVQTLTNEVKGNKKKFLGICLGMQLMSTIGTEPEPTNGLGWIDGKVVKLEIENQRIPHLGWNDISIKNEKHFNSIDNLNFYFIHSYHFMVNDIEKVSSTVNYGVEIVSSITHENMLATQFHPEKSQESGLALLKNFLFN